MTKQEMENFKGGVLDVLEMMAFNFRNPDVGQSFFVSWSCLMCQIYFAPGSKEGDCRGCPFANKEGNEGCSQLKNYLTAYEKWTKVCIEEIGDFGLMIYTYPAGIQVNPEFILLAFTIERAIKILKELPAERFTKEGWKYVKELDDLRITSSPGLEE